MTVTLIKDWPTIPFQIQKYRSNREINKTAFQLQQYLALASLMRVFLKLGLLWTTLKASVETKNYVKLGNGAKERHSDARPLTFL